MENKRKKEKNLIPSHRDNRRYLIVEASKEKIEKAILDYIGILGWGEAAPVFVGDILSVKRDGMEKIRAAFELAGIKVRRISGTIEGLKK